MKFVQIKAKCPKYFNLSLIFKIYISIINNNSMYSQLV